MTQAETTQAEPQTPAVEQEQAAVEKPAPASELDKFIEGRDVTWRAPTIQETARDLPDILGQAKLYWEAGVCGNKTTLAQANAKALGAHSLGKTMMWGFENLCVSKDGRLGMSAIGMRGLFLERVPGARIEYLETTPERCIMRAFRPGKGWTQCDWTQADSDRAGLVAEGRGERGPYTTTHGKYPEDMKVARCTSRLARRCWPDILGGCTYLPEELGENIADPADAPNAAPDAPQAPTRQERQEPAKPPALTATAVYLRWHALAKAGADANQLILPDGTDDLPKCGARFGAFCAALLGADVPNPRALTVDELGVIVADMEKNKTPVPFDQREIPNG
jgi:hypothetical protein